MKSSKKYKQFKFNQIMDKKQPCGEYLAPNVKVVEMKVQNHILQTSLDNINRKDSVWDE